MSAGVLDRCIRETPIAIVDFETTGLSPGQDRVVELSVVRMDPGQQPKQVLDSLVNPQRKVSGTEIHGITDADVADAPTFPQLASDFLMAISGCVLAAHNAYYDLEFLLYELSQVGIRGVPPYLCLMHMQPLLGLGDRCELSVACERMGIPFPARHNAAAEAWVESQLMLRYLDQMDAEQIKTFAQLRERKPYKFFDSLATTPAEFSLVTGNCRLKRRTARPQPLQATAQNPAIYWDALTAAVSDLQITAEEVHRLTELRRKLNLSDDHLRMFHARLFAAVLRQVLEDQRVDAKEVRKLQLLTDCLRRLGWAPGD